MTSKEFYNKFKDKFYLDNKKWLFLNTKKTYLNNYNVVISGYRELDFDYLYFYINNQVWQLNLTSDLSWLSPVHTTREVFKLIISGKKTHYATTDTGKKVMLKYYNPKNNVNGNILINLQDFAVKMFSTIDEEKEKVEFNFTDKTPANKSDLLSNIREYLKLKSDEYDETFSIFTNKCEHGKIIDLKLTKINNKSELSKKDFVDLVGYLILTLEEKNWTTFEDIL